MTKARSAEEPLGNITALVRGYASVNCIVRVTQTAAALGVARPKVEMSFRALIHQGVLRRAERGVYVYVDQPKPGKNSTVEDKIWRAMLIHPMFTCSEIARVAGTTTNYVGKVLHKYLAEEYAEPAGRHTAFSGFSEKKWRLTSKGRVHKQRPLLKAFEPDPLVVKTVTLNRLVCTGVALRMVDNRERAIRLCEEIVEILSETQRLDGHDGNPKGKSHETARDNDLPGL